MNSLPDDNEETPEPPLSELFINLEDKFVCMQDANKGENMNVYARIRPMLDSEIEDGYKECVGLINEQVVRAVAPASSSKFKMSSHLCQDIIEDFTFTAAYGPETGQFVFFQECMMDTMKNFIEGHNSLVFSYGTTGSGKTFTLQGDADNPGIIPLSLHLFFASVEDQLLDKVFFKPDKFSNVVALNDNEIKSELEIKEQLLSVYNQEDWSSRNSSKKSLGVLLCETFSDHFEAEGCQTTLGPEEMAQAQAAALIKEIGKKSAGKQSGYCSVWVSFVEIYNENIYDLLQPNVNQRTKLNLGEDKNGDVYVKGLQEVCVSNSYEALNLLNFGQRNLRIASTKLNYQSSRSHCIFTIKVIRIPDPENMSYAKVNRLSFCDLAGSERAAKSQTTGLRLKEAGCINTSLLVLGRCLEQLRLKPSLRDKKLIPFRESKLTRLFSGFFTGRGKAVMITNASPCELTFDETLHVLRFSAVAKELIINDRYIMTASNTLQSIANMWKDDRANSKNQSQSSDKSISFEDSMDEVIQEKDELIEKLLDLAESLKSNLEQEKKEKAELEIKIRQDVCVEYSEYRDELLSMQKQAFEEERDAIKQIYEKRIAAMDKRYEKIISDFKSQLEESFVSDDEVSKDAFETPSSENEVEEPELGKNALENGNFEITDSYPKSNIITDIKDSRKTEEELQKTVDYSLSLEVELEHLRKKYEDTQSSLENIMKENDDIKKELDAYKIDILGYRTDNENLLKDKQDLEADLKAFREDLVTVTEEKEVLFQELADSKDKISSLNSEIHNLLKSINELTKEKEESIMKYKKSLEDTYLNNDQLKDQLIDASVELEAEKKKIEDLESIISSMEKTIAELQAKELDNSQLKRAVETLSKETDELKNQNISLKKEVEVAKASVASFSQSEHEAKDEIEKMKEFHQKEIKKLNDSLKKFETEAKEAEEILKSFNNILGNSQDVIEKQKKELNSLEKQCASLKNELSQVQTIREDMEGKLEVLSANLELEKQKRSELEDKLETAKEKAAKFDLLQSNHLAYENEIASLRKTNLTLEEKLLSSSQECESEINFKQQLENEGKKLEEALSTINSLKCENQKCLDELADIKKEKCDLENKLDNINSQNDNIQRLVQILEKREFESTNKIAEMQSDLTELRMKLDINSVNHEKECGVLHELIDLLEKCEAFASNKTKQFHSTCIKYVEQLMDLENSIKTKDKLIDVLNNDIDDLKKKYKDLQASSKKQLQAEVQKFKSESDDMEKKMTGFKKLIESLKSDLAKLEVEKDELEKRYKSLKEKEEKIEEKECNLKNKTSEKRTSREKREESSSKEEAKEVIIVLKEISNQEDRKRNRKSAEQSENKKQNTDIPKYQEDRKRNRKSAEQSENKKQNTDIPKVQENKRRNRKIVENSENIAENKKQKTQIYEEIDESSISGAKQEKRAGGRQLRCLSNVAGEKDLVQKEAESSLKTRTAKRKIEADDEYKSRSKKALKNLKMDTTVNDAENACRPENLRIQLLKRSVNVNDIPLPSPRMTRGRKRLFMAKGIPVSPRTVRS